MDDTFLRSMLLDYYGELLTEKQRECFDLHYNQDLSLQEIAEMYGATRQAVWAQTRQAERTLRAMEERMGLVARSLRRREELGALLSLAQRLPEGPVASELRTRLAALMGEETGKQEATEYGV